jgi:hypothetical protein
MKLKEIIVIKDSITNIEFDRTSNYKDINKFYKIHFPNHISEEYGENIKLITKGVLKENDLILIGKENYKIKKFDDEVYLDVDEPHINTIIYFEKLT